MIMLALSMYCVILETLSIHCVNLKTSSTHCMILETLSIHGVILQTLRTDCVILEILSIHYVVILETLSTHCVILEISIKYLLCDSEYIFVKGTYFLKRNQINSKSLLVTRNITNCGNGTLHVDYLVSI